jgi:hypothetical protein
MATLVLQVAGTAIGSMLGGPIGAAIGSAVGAMAGSAIDQSLMGSGARRFEGPRLKSLDGISANEGAAVPRIYGRVRIGGQVIWATKFEEQAQVTRQGKSGGKSLGKGAKTTTYSYFANVAIGLCEGPVAMVRRVWADGKPLDLTKVTMRFHDGSEDQQPDPLVLAKQGDAPAYRGIAYVVFERLPLEDYGNRLPQLSFEVVRPVGPLAGMVRGVTLIPGATEFGYATGSVTRNLGLGSTAAENRNQLTHPTDLDASLDALEACCPNAASVAFVASWFGDDLRAGNCTIRPGIDSAIKQTIGATWSVAGLTRQDARLVTQVEGRAAYGGTPSDASVIAALTDLKARGKSVVFYPFVMMDVPAGNTLPNPYGGTGQAAFPWRGRVTCHPAPGMPGSPDGTAAAATQVTAFFGTAAASHFAISGSTISYSGPAEWSYRRFILHNAALAKIGGADAFIIGSEMVGLTRVRSAATSYAAAAEFKALATEVRTLLGPAVKIGYAADWSEYGAHVRNGGADVGFPLDPLWADANIDFIGIDYYPPVSDWREGTAHLDALAGHDGRDIAYLKGRFGAGEAFDWYYASEVDRTAQVRTPITDGAYGKPWVFRAKDLAGWWANSHRPRVAGVEQAPTAWVAQSKPIWLTEIGCPAVDKGANAPNLFADPKSDESGYPPFSLRGRDDLVQARFLEAAMRRFDPAAPGFDPAHNPASTLYAGRMIDPARIHVWAWDARPYPAFPHLSTVWGDAENWLTGHWLNGRIEGMPLDALIRAVAADFGLPQPETFRCDGFVDGYVIDRPMAARAAIDPLLQLFGVDAAVSAGSIGFAGRGSATVLDLTRDDLVPDSKGREITRIRAQETELPRQITLGFSDAEAQYRSATTASRRLDTPSRLESSIETTAVLARNEAEVLTERMVQEVWVGRERAEFTLRPGLLPLECGDIVRLPGSQDLFKLTRLTDGTARQCEARRIEPSIYAARARRAELTAWASPAVAGPAHPLVLHLAADPGDPVALAWLALRAEPWAGPYSLWRSADGASFDPVGTIERSAILGETLAPFGPGPLWRWDRGSTLEIRLAEGALASGDELTALGERNLIAIGDGAGNWEILSYRDATLTGPLSYRLTGLIRGRYGSEDLAARVLPAGSPVVLLDGALVPLFEGTDSLGRTATFRVAPAGLDHADPTAVQFAASAGTAAVLPMAPVHARARRTAQGVSIAFIRRTRRGGDNWDVADVPLGEQVESYVVDVLDGTVVKRSLTAATTAVLYPVASETADFGAPQASLTLNIRQVSQAAGPGLALVATVPVLLG